MASRAFHRRRRQGVHSPDVGAAEDTDTTRRGCRRGCRGCRGPRGGCREARADDVPGGRRRRLRFVLVRVRRRRPAATRGPQLARALGTRERIHHPTRGCRAGDGDGATRRAAGAGGVYRGGRLQRRRMRRVASGGSRRRMETGPVGPVGPGPRPARLLRARGLAGDGDANLGQDQDAHARGRRGGQRSVPFLPVRSGDGVQATRGRELAGRAAHRGWRVRHRREQRYVTVEVDAAVLPERGVSRRRDDFLHGYPRRSRRGVGSGRRSEGGRRAVFPARRRGGFAGARGQRGEGWANRGPAQVHHSHRRVVRDG
mmetsp:Transcript_2320/g.6055  ORF Transcript_2320/g.6055 Transcript_2320/m.6055 type:complete len:314 (-) Transcript_2320:126-1067(-)